MEKVTRHNIGKTSEILGLEAIEGMLFLLTQDKLYMIQVL